MGALSSSMLIHTLEELGGMYVTKPPLSGSRKYRPLVQLL